MPIPDYQSLMLPLLRFVGECNGEASISSAMDFLAKEYGLTEDELSQMLPSGQQTTFSNRVGWAATYMRQAGLLQRTWPGYCAVTARGREVLRSEPNSISNKFLSKFPEFRDFLQQKGKRRKGPPKDGEERSYDMPATPMEALEAAYQGLREELAEELLARLKKASPSFFERCVVELLVAMGYGGSRVDAGKAIGRTGDGGIDGIIKEDRLGLEVVYIQAKRWDSTPVGRPEVMQFAGALQAQKANKGVFITTSRFTDEAREYVSQIGCKIVLIDGKQLTDYMIEYNIGVSTVFSYPVKRVDNDYFEGTI